MRERWQRKDTIVASDLTLVKVACNRGMSESPFSASLTATLLGPCEGSETYAALKIVEEYWLRLFYPRECPKCGRNHEVNMLAIKRIARVLGEGALDARGITANLRLLGVRRKEGKSF